jgi:hypothetical protein
MKDNEAPIADVEELTGEILVIDPRALLPGDIVLSTAAGFDSWIIRTGTGSRFSHAMLHVGNGVAVEANDPGVVQVFLPVLGHHLATRLSVRRMPGLTHEQRSELIQHALGLLYRPYSIRGAVGSVIPKLRKATDPGQFCSQLVAHCYSMIGKELCENCAAEAVTPQDIAASKALITVEEGVRSVSLAVHVAVSGPYAQKYELYLNSIAKFERQLIEQAEALIPTVVSERSFNIFDVARQVSSAQVSEDVREQCDELLANMLEEAILKAPLRPCPGLSVATFLIYPVPMPAVFTKAWEVVSTSEGQRVFRERLEETFRASQWELTCWLEEAHRLGKIGEATGFNTPFALAVWMEQAALIRLNYAKLVGSSAGKVKLPLDEKKEIREVLQAMIEQDPEGASEFSPDPWMLLQQSVVSPD